MNPKVHSFIVRIWNESEEGHETENSEWRGSIDHVGTGRRLYFRDLNSILCFIREQASDAFGSPSRGLTASLLTFWKRLSARTTRKSHER